MHQTTRFLWISVLLASTPGCMSAYMKSVGGDTEKTYQKVFLTEYDLAWASALESMKSFYLDITNREAGIIQTRWTENTAERAFSESFGSASTNYKAQFRFKVLVSSGFFDGKKSVRISVRKEQLIQTDVLEGWQPVESDAVEENTLLYRIGRLIQMKTRLDEIENQRREKEASAVKF